MLRPCLLACLLLLVAAPAAAPAAVQKGLVVSGDLSALAQEARAGWVRLFVPWRQLEPERGRFEPGATEAVVDAYVARGIKVYLVVFDTPGWANGGRAPNVPPSDPADFGSFVGRLAERMGTRVGAYEIWNEPDGDEGVWFAGSTADYAALLKAAHPAVKRAAPGAKVLTAGLVGNDVAYVEELYRLGAGPFFDAVAVHTDTACLDKGPDFYYREPDGRIGRYAFTGYREIHEVLKAHGDGAKTIWMTELGWNTKQAACDQGAVRTDRSRRSGVSPEQQAANLTRAYQCLAQDPYVEVATWFELRDRAARSADALSTNYFGLVEVDGARKPSFAAFQRAGGSTGAECGGYIDKVAPKLSVRAPVPGTRFTGALLVDVRGTDDRRLVDIDLIAGGRRVAKGIEQGADTTRGALQFTWHGAAKLPAGRHRLLLRGRDEAHNIVERAVEVEKIGGSGAGATRAPVRLAASIGRVRARKLRVTGTIRAGAGVTGRPTGKAQIQFDRYDTRSRRYKRYSRYTFKASRGRFAKVYRFKKPGRWRVIVRYVPGKAPFRAATLRPRTVRVR